MPRQIVQNYASVLDLPGASSSRIQIAKASQLNFGTGDFTYSIWTKLRFPGVQRIIYAYSSNTSKGFYLGIAGPGSEVIVNMFGTGATNITAGTTKKVNDNQWHLLTVTRNGTVITLYVDGVAYAPGAINDNLDGTSPLFIGSDLGSGSNFNGQLVDLNIYNRALSSTEVTNMYYSGILPTSGLIARYPLQEGTGTTATDTISANNGAITAGSWSGDVPSRQRTLATNRAGVQDMKASLFFNLNGYTLSPVAVVSLSNPYSVEFWFKAPIQQQGNTLFSCGSSTLSVPFFRIHMGTAAGKIGIQIRNDASTDLLNTSGNNLFFDNKWHHLVWTDNAGAGKLYLDGVLESNFNYTPIGTLTLDQTAIGTLLRILNPTGRMLGNVINTITYSAVLTPADVMTRYNGGTVNKTIASSWRLQEGTGSVAYDTSGNGNNATITSGTYTSDVPSRKRQLVGGNLISNADFEYAPPSATNVATTGSIAWIDGSSGGSSTNNIFGMGIVTNQGSGSCFFDSSTSHSGTYSMCVTTNATSRTKAIISYNTTGSSLPPATLSANALRILPNTAYTLTYWVKTLNADTGAGFVSWDQHSGSGTRVASTNSATSFTGTNGWTKVTDSFTSNSTAAYIIIQLQNGVAGTGGTVWFDDITLTQNPSPLRSLA